MNAMSFRYFASFRRDDGTDYRVRIDGRLSTHGMKQAALKIAQRLEHAERFKTVTIERESAAGTIFNRLLPVSLAYPIRV